jgi:hypothetical protein
MGKYEIKVEKNGKAAKVHVTGVIDEDVDFGAHALSGVSTVEMKLGGIKGINSCGIREWIKWVGTAGNATISYFECPKIIVDQINMVQGFLPHAGKVLSFYVPYYSEEAGTEKSVLFTYGKEFTEEGVSAPPNVLDEEGNAMEMDVVEAKYFKFLKKS